MTGSEPPKISQEMQEMSDSISDLLSLGRRLQGRLEFLAEGCRIVGLDKLSNDLLEMSDLTYEAGKRVNSAFSGVTSMQLRQAEEGSALMLKAILAGVFATPEERAARATPDVVSDQPV